MKRLITKYPIPNILLGIILIAFAIYATLMTTIMYDSIIYIVSAIVIIYAILKLYRDVHYFKKQTAKLLMSLEFALNVTLAILLVAEVFSLAIILGLILYIRGANFLLILQVRKMATSVKRYFVNLILITLGAYIFFTNNAYTEILQYILFALIILYGILLLYFGIVKLVQMSKDKKSVTAEPLEHNDYTKSALKEKNVNTLKQMCKERNITGYSTLTKDELVEKLWLYEKEQ